MQKKPTEENSENDKDLTTEKKAAAAAADAAAKGDGAAGDASADAAKDEAAAASGSPKEEDISPLADESIKSKSKKDKVKKKWSFRSISFGKKDKQKPAKTEEPASPTAAAATAETVATNGEAERPADAAEGAAADKAEVNSTKTELLFLFGLCRYMYLCICCLAVKRGGNSCSCAGIACG